MTLVEENGKTVLTMRGGPLNANEEEHAAFADMHSSMQQCFAGKFDKLADYLACRK